MISANTAKEKIFVMAMASVAAHVHQVANDPLMSFDDKIKVLTWVRQKIPDLNRLLVELKTKEISGE